MKLGLKLTIGLLGGIVAVSLGTEVLRYRQSAKSLANFSSENLEALEQREWRNAANVYQVAEHVLMDALVEGEMGKIEDLLKLFSGVGGVDQYTFYDADGKAVYSSAPSFLGHVLPQDLQRHLADQGNTCSNSTAQSFDFYRPILVTDKCLECHESLKPGTIGAFTHLAVSNREVTQARAQWTGAMNRMSRAERTKAVVAASILIVIFSGLAFAMVRHLITRPLDRVIGSLRASTGEVRLASEAMTISSQAIADGASQQAASLEETSASLEEMASMTRLNADSALKAKDIAQQTRAAAEAGAADMHTMSQVIGEIKASSDNVAKIMSAIDEIAFQTNMLALNAAVEAARAGDAGAGFAVVADEVRTLAQRAADAAKETADKIEVAIARSSEAVEVGSGMAGRLQEIVDRVRQVDDLVAQVATASQDQSQGIAQVNLAINEMDRITQGNAASAEESASGATELHSQAETLDHAVGDLLRVVNGDETPDSRSAESPEPTDLPEVSTAIDQPAHAPVVRQETRPAVRELVPLE